jgi:hypothetical protein
MVVYFLPEDVQDFCVMPPNSQMVDVIRLVGIVLPHNVLRADGLWLYLVGGGYDSFTHKSFIWGWID